MQARLTFSFLVVAGVACGDSADTGSAMPMTEKDSGIVSEAAAEAAAPTPDATSEITARTTCVPPGTPNNEKGMGGYCTSTTDCDGDAGVRLCSKDFGGADWFCTYPCVMDDECGSGEYCAHTPQGSGCVPLACASSDGGASDASAD